MESTIIQKKLTLQAMGFDKASLKKLVTENPKSQNIANILACVVDKKVEASRLDPTKTNTRFIGTFEGVNLITGEEFHSSEAFFPGVAESFMTSIMGNGAFDGSKAAVTGFSITVQADTAPNSAMGYKFGVVAVADKTKSDPFKELRLALPAPRAKAGAKK